MSKIADAIRQRVFERAGQRCEYCHTQRDIVIFLQIDHIVPTSKGGTSCEENLCVACQQCNRYKAEHITGMDVETAQEVALFNPRNQKWTLHFIWDSSGTLVVGKTPTGRATVARLQMNDPQIILARARWVKVGWHPPADDLV